MADNSQILSASCNKCGASLELPPGLRFATCQFCGSRLEVRFTGGVVYTEVLDASADGDRQIAHDLQLIKLQNELNRLDQEWNLERERYRIHHIRGQTSLPTSGHVAISVLGGLVAVAFGIFWIVSLSDHDGPSFMVLFGVVFIAAAIVMTIYTLMRREQYMTAMDQYEGQRREILDALRNYEAQYRGVSPAAPGSASP
jgi:hypothetical protein